MRRGISLQSVFYSSETSTAFPAKKVPGKSPGPDTSITVLRLCRFCSELLFIIYSKHKKTTAACRSSFCIFHTVLLPERFADHRSAFTFGTHLWDSPEGHPVTVPSFLGTPESIIPSAGFRLLSCNLLLARYVVSLMLLL